MKALDMALVAAVGLECVVVVTAIAYITRPEWFARFVSDAFLMRHSLWKECDGEPINMWAEELVRRDEAMAATQATEGAK